MDPVIYHVPTEENARKHKHTSFWRPLRDPEGKVGATVYCEKGHAIVVGAGGDEHEIGGDGLVIPALICEKCAAQGVRFAHIVKLNRWVAPAPVEPETPPPAPRTRKRTK